MNVNATRSATTSYVRAVDLKRLRFITNEISSMGSNDGIILDVGCGNENISRHLGHRGHKVHGVDISEKAIQQAQSLNSLKHVQFFVKSAEELEEEGIQYEAIICSEVLEHLVNPMALLKQLHKLLKREGILIITVPNGNGPREVLMTKPLQRIQKENGKTWKIVSQIKKSLGYNGKTVQSDADDLTHIQFFTKKDLMSLSQNSNFKIVKFENADFIEDVFPISILTKRSQWLQKIDCKLADLLPHYLTGGFHSVWIK